MVSETRAVPFPSEPLGALQRANASPLYVQVYDQLCQLLEQEDLQAGDLFPGELDLVKQFGVSRITVRRAISELVRERRLVRYAGRGTFVAQPKIERELVDVASFSARMHAVGLHAGARVLEVKTLPATPRLSNELDVPLKAPILALLRLRSTNDEPIALETSFLSLDRCPNLDKADLNNRSLYQVLESEYNLRPVQSHKTLEITTASLTEAQHLQVTQGAPLFLLRATVYGVDGPFEYNKNLLRGDRFRFKV
jgi:GntR family transcriptional regulator